MMKEMLKRRMVKMTAMLVFMVLFLNAASYSQLYIDVFKAYYAYTPNQGINDKDNPLSASNYNINVMLPIELKKGGDAILVNPAFDHNKGTIAGRSFRLVGRSLGLGFLKKFNPEWSLLSIAFFKRNKEQGKDLDYPTQYGGAVFATWNKNPSLSLKLGLYYNHEFFRDLIIPLAGIEWQIDSRNNISGLLPNNLFYEHKINSTFYWGATFHAATNGYRMQSTNPCASGDCNGKNYLRVNDNQLGLYADTYITPKIVFSAEAGYTLFRKYKYMFKGEQTYQYTDFKNDNLYVRASIGYRLRFR